MNFLWAGMIIIGVGYGAATGNVVAVSQAALDSAESAITLCITMLGVMGFWMGLMEIATKAGIIESLSKKMQPIFHWLFPGIPIGSKAQEYISTNMIANFLGLGWAATPAGLKAMEELSLLAECQQETTRVRKNSSKSLPAERKYATDEMCTFLVINISSLQLIPINIIAYRTQYGSSNPTAVLGPAIVATAISTIVGVFFCKATQNFHRKFKIKQ
ncbi:MAG: nucleoside recognition protein [Eubacteriales bacterium]